MLYLNHNEYLFLYEHPSTFDELGWCNAQIPKDAPHSDFLTKLSKQHLFAQIEWAKKMSQRLNSKISVIEPMEPFLLLSTKKPILSVFPESIGWNVLYKDQIGWIFCDQGREWKPAQSSIDT